MRRHIFRGEDRTLIAALATAQIKTKGGRIARILVRGGDGTNAFDIFDHASANSNNVYSSPVVTEGQIFDLDIPCKNGIRITTGTGVLLTAIWS